MFELQNKTSTVKVRWVSYGFTYTQSYHDFWWFSFFERKVKKGFRTQEVAF